MSRYHSLRLLATFGSRKSSIHKSQCVADAAASPGQTFPMSSWNAPHLPPSLGSGQMFSTINSAGTLYPRVSPKLPRVPENAEVDLRVITQKEEKSPEKERSRMGRSGDCILIQNTTLRLFRREDAILAPGELAKLHQCIRKLLFSKTAPFIMDYYKQELLTKGMIILRENIKLEKGLSLLEHLEETWERFFTKTLPTLEAIMYPMKTHGSSAIRRTTLASFRDIVVLKIRLDAAIRSNRDSIPSGIKHMLLVLQSVNDGYPPNKNKLLLESLVALVVIPYLGFRGLYQGDKDPIILSSEPAIASRKKSGDATVGRRVSRPLSVQPHQMENLNDLFLAAIRKQQASSFVR